MLVPLTGKKQLFQLLAEIPVIVKYSHNVILDDVGHKYPFSFDILPLSRNKREMLHQELRKNAKKADFSRKSCIFAT